MNLMEEVHKQHASHSPLQGWQGNFVYGKFGRIGVHNLIHKYIGLTPGWVDWVSVMVDTINGRAVYL
jgi:hypothetical protein